MALLYSDENVPVELVRELRRLGHDVLRAWEDGMANQGIDDSVILARASLLGRAVVTNDRNDYHHLHQLDSNHAGIITFTRDNAIALAGRIEAAISAMPSLVGQLIKIVRPSRPPKP